MKKGQTINAVLAALGFSKEMVAVLDFSLWSMLVILWTSEVRNTDKKVSGDCVLSAEADVKDVSIEKSGAVSDVREEIVQLGLGRGRGNAGDLETVRNE